MFTGLSEWLQTMFFGLASVFLDTLKWLWDNNIKMLYPLLSIIPIWGTVHWLSLVVLESQWFHQVVSSWQTARPFLAAANAWVPLSEMLNCIMIWVGFTISAYTYRFLKSLIPTVS